MGSNSESYAFTEIEKIWPSEFMQRKQDAKTQILK